PTDRLARALRSGFSPFARGAPAAFAAPTRAPRPRVGSRPRASRGRRALSRALRRSRRALPVRSNAGFSSASPLGDRAAARRDPKLGLELAAPLHRDDRVLDDSVVLLVRGDAAEGRLVDADTPARDVAHAAVLLVADRQRQPRAVGRDRLDDQVEILRGRILVRDAPDAGELSGPGDDAQLVLPLERGTQRAELPNGFAGRVVIAPLERRLARVRERMRLRDRRGLGRDIDDGLMRG